MKSATSELAEVYFYDQVVQTWIDLRIYLQDHNLDWLDCPGSFQQFYQFLRTAQENHRLGEDPSLDNQW